MLSTETSPDGFSTPRPKHEHFAICYVYGLNILTKLCHSVFLILMHKLNDDDMSGVDDLFTLYTAIAKNQEEEQQQQKKTQQK